MKLKGVARLSKQYPGTWEWSKLFKEPDGPLVGVGVRATSAEDVREMVREGLLCGLVETDQDIDTQRVDACVVTEAEGGDAA